MQDPRNLAMPSSNFWNSTGQDALRTGVPLGMSFPGMAHEALSGLLRVRPLPARSGTLRWHYRDASLQLTLGSAVPYWPDARVVKRCCGLTIQSANPL
jgi:hypothetical protein